MTEIKNTKLTENDTTGTLLALCLNYAGEKGLDIPTIRSRVRVLGALEGIKVGGVIKLEDADYATAQTVIKEVRWASVGKHLITFAEQFGV